MRFVKKRGFTLIELLLVIAVMGLLMAITVPAFVDIGRGSRMNTAVNQLRGTLNLARQMAITQRVNVHVLFPDAQRNLYNNLGTEHHRKAMRSYAVVTDGGGYVTDWKYLPDGVYFIDQFAGSGDSQNKNTVNDNINKLTHNNSVFYNSTNNLIRTNFPDNVTANKPYINILTFRPDGKVAKAGVNPKEIFLAEAVALDTPTKSDVVELVWKENPVIMGITIMPFTGTTTLVDYTQVD